MVQIKKDRFFLGQTPIKALDSAGKKIKADIKLELAPGGGQVISVNLSGKVVDSSNVAIAGALVSIMDGNYQPLIQTITDASGNYNFGVVPVSNNYKIFSIATGKQLNQGADLILYAGATLTRNFTLVNETVSTLGIIAGDITKTNTTVPVQGAAITLHDSAGEALVAVTYTNDFGQYVFRDIPIGNYFIQVSGLGYIPKRILNVGVATAGQVVSKDISLDSEAVPANGTASGVIIDAEGNPIPRADVVLYSIGANGELSALGYTKTNTSGVYLFTNVPPGSYRAKSNFTEGIDFIFPTNDPRPNVDNFVITESATVNTINTHANTGILSNGAVINTTTAVGFVEGIGGTGRGMVRLSVDIPSEGYYKMSITHINTTVRNLLVDIQGVPTGTTYALTATNTANLADARVDDITVYFTQGTRVITLYGANDVNYAPSIGPITLTKLAVTDSKPQYGFTLSGGATFNLTNGFLNGVGINGVAITNVKVPRAGVYNLVISYWASQVRPLRIDVNGTYIGQEYSFPISTVLDPAATLTIPLTLALGDNTLRFYNTSTTVSAPDIKEIKVIEQEALGRAFTTNANIGELRGGAIVNSSSSTAPGFVDSLGGASEGSSTLVLYAPKTGQYKLGVTYLASSVKYLLLSINNIPTGIQYDFPATAGLNTAQALVKNIIVSLSQGANIVKIYGPTNPSSAPMIGNITYTLEPGATHPNTGVYTNGATVNPPGNLGGYVVQVGGPSAGAVTFNVNVGETGFYKFGIKYSTINNNAMLIDVNGASTSETYVFPKTSTANEVDALVYYISLYLVKGSNSIKFYNTANPLYAPALGPITIDREFMSTFTNTGVVANGARVNPSNNVAPGFVDLIGGPSGGFVTLSIDSEMSGFYNFDITYVATTVRDLFVDINGISSGFTYSFPATAGWTPADAKSYRIRLYLNKGLNTIKLYGTTGATYAPVLGKININFDTNLYSVKALVYTLTGAAYYNDTVKLIRALGKGLGDGSVTFRANIKGEYNLLISYWANTARILRVDVNGVYTGTEYSVPIATSTAPYAVLTVPVTFVPGDNTVRLYNTSATTLCPDFTGIDIVQVPYTNAQEAESATLSGSATASNGFVTGLGGLSSGSITVTKTVPFAGVYDIAIKYVSSVNPSKIMVIVNGTAVGSQVSFPQTATMNVADAKVVVTRVYLNAGSNTIKLV